MANVKVISARPVNGVSDRTKKPWVAIDLEGLLDHDGSCTYFQQRCFPFDGELPILVPNTSYEVDFDFSRNFKTGQLQVRLVNFK